MCKLPTKTITIPPRAVLCEVQPVTIHHQSTESSSTTSILDHLDITKSYLTDDQLQTGINLIQSFEDIFVKDDINIGNTHVKHRINLNDDRPFKQRNRQIPPAMFDEVKEHIRQLLTDHHIALGHPMLS